MKKFFAGLTAVIVALGLTGCASAPKEWSRGTGEISIVATTNVWADLAYQIGGSAVTANAIIYNVNQDPHSFEASARDQLLINEADLVITNGGGYDDFMTTMLDARTSAVEQLDAVEVAGTDETGNEHIWLDVERVRIVAAEIAARIKAIEPSVAAEIDSNLAVANTKLDRILAAQKQIQTERGGTKVLQLDPLSHYVVKGVGFVDLTPASALAAIESDSEITPTDMKLMEELLKSGQIKIAIVNASGTTSQTEKLLSVNYSASNLGLSELLEQDPDTFEYSGDFFTYLEGAAKSPGWVLDTDGN